MMAERVLKTDTKKALKEAFKVFDKNGDGRICAKELTEALTRVGETLTREEVTELMKNVDIDKNGSLCYNGKYILYLHSRVGSTGFKNVGFQRGS